MDVLVVFVKDSRPVLRICSRSTDEFHRATGLGAERIGQVEQRQVVRDLDRHEPRPQNRPIDRTSFLKRFGQRCRNIDGKVQDSARLFMGSSLVVMLLVIEASGSGSVISEIVPQGGVVARPPIDAVQRCSFRQ